MSSRIVRVAAASRLALEFRIVLPVKVKIKDSTSSVYSRLYCIYQSQQGFVVLMIKETLNGLVLNYNRLKKSLSAQ